MGEIAHDIGMRATAPYVENVKDIIATIAFKGIDAGTAFNIIMPCPAYDNVIATALGFYIVIAATCIYIVIASAALECGHCLPRQIECHRHFVHQQHRRLCRHG